MSTVHVPPHRPDVSRASRRRAGDGPLLILGPPRSSQSLLACAVAQHPQVGLVLDTSWMPRLGEALTEVHRAGSRLGPRSALAASQVRRSDLLAALGSAMGGLLAPTGAVVDGAAPPWVSSGTVTRPEEITWLRELFPAARIVHLVRHPDAVARSLAGQACGDGHFAARADAYRTWSVSTTALARAQQAYGADHVTRVTVSQLHSRPQTVLARCLGLLGLALHDRCLTPLQGAIADAERTAADADADARTGAESDRAAALALHAQLSTTAEVVSGEEAVAATLRAAAGRSPISDVVDGDLGYRQLVALAVPPGATAAVISKGDDALLAVPGRQCTHLPAAPDGRYAGHHPADSRDALDHLVSAIRSGARYLVVPGASGWWLQHYRGFADHLLAHARVVAHHESIATVYAIAAGQEASP